MLIAVVGKFLESQFHGFILFCCWYGRTAFVHELVKQVKKKGRTEGGQYSHWSLLRLLAIFTGINHLSRPRNPISVLHSTSSNCWSNLFLTFLLRWPLLLKRPSRISRRQSPKCRFLAERKGCRNFFFLRRFQICLEKQAIWRISANWPNIQLFFHHWLRFQAAEKAKTADLAQSYQPRPETGSKVPSKFGPKPDLTTWLIVEWSQHV